MLEGMVSPKKNYETNPFPVEYSTDGKTFYAVEIEINSRCNRTCSYCPNSVGERIEQGEMAPEIYQRIMQQLQDIQFKGRISYEFFNEPMLCSHFFEYVEMTKQYIPDCTIELYTNGTLLTYDKFQKLVSFGIDHFVVTKHEGIDQYCFDHTWKKLSDQEKSLVKYQTHEELKKSNRGGVVKAGPERSTVLLPCYIPEQIVTITVAGNVLPCFEDFYQNNMMGNVGEDTLINIWNSEKYKKFRYELRKALRHMNTPCKTCNRVEVLPDLPESMMKEFTVK